MVVFPHCKINLGLRIVSKRPDGYHNIETCFYPVPFTDILEIVSSESFSFSHSGLEVPGRENENLCVRAYHLLAADYPVPPIKLHLHKVIPMGAGLGGGSSDAAFTLRMINQHFNLNIADEKLQHYATRLGSDCAFFVQDLPKIGSGRGELLSDCPVHLSGSYCVLVKPEIHVSTADAYARVKAAPRPNSLNSILQQPIANWKNSLTNDFEPTVFEQYPVLAELKNALYTHGALYASMSGSGAAIFGIFEKPVSLKKTFAGLTYWAGILP